MKGFIDQNTGGREEEGRPVNPQVERRRVGLEWVGIERGSLGGSLQEGVGGLGRIKSNLN